ncbi:putative ribonuclease H-like domain-containing protein [Tanacetum coccineum]|uniref:Ribonuclease H-like domain-containing protein n=1 Tax=Tanacetum coccineum TaxID=301880 RepID=A0ABQ5H540_9ASTR
MKILVPSCCNKSGIVPVNAAKQSSLRAAASISTARHVNIVALKLKVNATSPIKYSYFKSHSPVRRAFNQKSATKTNNLNEKVITARVNNVTTAESKAVVPTGKVIDHIFKDSGYAMTYKDFDYGNPDNMPLQDQGIFDRDALDYGSHKGWEKLMEKGKLDKRKHLTMNTYDIDHSCFTNSPTFFLQVLRAQDDKDVIEKEGYANSTNRDSTASPSVSTARPSINTASENINTGSPDINIASPIPNDSSMQSLKNTGIFDGAYDDEDVGTEADLNNLETTMNVSPIPTTRIHKYYPKDQIIGDINSATQTRRMIKIFEEHAIIDVKSAFLYGTIEEEVYVCQPPGFEDPQFPNKVYKVEKALYGLHQAPKAWYETLSTYLLENGFRRGNYLIRTFVDQKDKGDILPDITFVVCACARFYVTLKVSHLHAVKRIFRYLKGQPKLALCYPRDSPFDLESFSDSDYVGASLDRKSTTREYVAAANCCRQAKHIEYLVGDEAVHKELGDRMERAATTASSLEAKHDSGSTIPVESHHTPISAPSTSQPPTLPPSMQTTHVAKEAATMPHDSPLLGGHTPGSDEGSMTLNEQTVLCTQLSTKVASLKADLKPTKKVYDNQEDPSKQGRKIAQIDEDKGITLVQMSAQTQGRHEHDLEEPDFEFTAPEELSTASPEVRTAAESLVYIIRSAAKRKDKGNVIMKEAEHAQKKTKLQLEQEKLRLQAQERERYSEADKARLHVELINERKRKFAQQRAEQRRNKPMTQAQQRTYMCNYIKHMGSHTLQELKKLSFDEIKELFEITMKKVNTFTLMESDDTVPKVIPGSSKRDADQELNQESSKRQKIGEGSEPAE